MARYRAGRRLRAAVLEGGVPNGSVEAGTDRETVGGARGTIQFRRMVPTSEGDSRPNSGTQGSRLERLFMPLSRRPRPARRVML
jgi:hypothetical protein